MWVTLSSTVIGILFLSDAFLQGFYSFLPQLTIVPLFILALVQISQANNDSSHQSDSLIFPILLCVGGALTWLLLLPVFALALLVVLVAHYKSIGIKEFTRIMTRNYSALLITILISILALGIQLYIFRQSDSGPSFINGVLLSGGINLYPITFYLVLCVGVALAFVYARARVDIIRPILYFASTLAVFITLIYLLQVYETQSTLYYYFKVLNTLTLLAAMVAILGFGFLIDKIQKQAGRGITIASIIIVLALGVQFIYTNPPIFAYAKGIRSMSNGTNQQVLELLKTSYSQSHYDTNEVTIFYPNNNPMLNEVAATLLKANKPYSDCYVGLKVSSMSVSVKDFSVEPINKYCGDEHISKITYLVDRGSQVQLQTTIEAAGLQDRVKVDLIRY